MKGGLQDEGRAEGCSLKRETHWVVLFTRK